MSKYKSRATQINEAICADITPDIGANQNLVNYIYLFNTEVDRIVAVFSLKDSKTSLPVFIGHMERFTKSNPNVVILTSRQHMTINDSNMFVAIKGKWSAIESNTYSNVINDMFHLFSVHSGAIEKSAEVVNRFTGEGLVYGLLDCTVAVAYHSGLREGQQAVQKNPGAQLISPLRWAN